MISGRTAETQKATIDDGHHHISANHSPSPVRVTLMKAQTGEAEADRLARAAGHKDALSARIKNAR